MLFGVAHTKSLMCSTRARNLNWTSLAYFDGLRVLNRDNIKPYINQEGQPVWGFLSNLSRLEPPPDSLRFCLDIEAERATRKHLGTPVPGPCMHALQTGYARKSAEPLGFCPKEGTRTSTGAHPPGMTNRSGWRRSALSVLLGAALLGANSQV